MLNKTECECAECRHWRCPECGENEINADAFCPVCEVASDQVPGNLRPTCEKRSKPVYVFAAAILFWVSVMAIFVFGLPAMIRLIDYVTKP